MKNLNFARQASDYACDKSRLQIAVKKIELGIIPKKRCIEELLEMGHKWQSDTRFGRSLNPYLKVLQEAYKANESNEQVKGPKKEVEPNVTEELYSALVNLGYHKTAARRVSLEVLQEEQPSYKLENLIPIALERI